MKKNTIFIGLLIIVTMFCFSITLAKEQKQIKTASQNASNPNVTTTNNGALQRSNTANFVQNLLNIANKEKNGVGEQIKLVAQEQNQIKNNIDEKIKKIQDRNRIKAFLIGNDYKNLGQLRSEVSKFTNQINHLKDLLDKATNEETKKTLEEQIKKLETEQTQANNFLKTNENKFSLFGWFAKFFNKEK